MRSENGPNKIYFCNIDHFLKIKFKNVCIFSFLIIGDRENMTANVYNYVLESSRKNSLAV